MRKILLASTAAALLGLAAVAGPVSAQSQQQPQDAGSTSTSVETRTETPRTSDDTGNETLREIGEAAESAAETTGDAIGSAAQSVADTADSLATDVEDAMTHEDTGEVMQPPGTILTEDLLGRPVQNYEGEDVARVDNFVITPDGEITHAVVSFGGFLGFNQKRTMISWSEFEVDQANSVLRLQMSREQITALPAFTRNDGDDDTRPLQEQQGAAPAPAAPAQ